MENRSLVRKLSEIMGAIERVQKRGTNAFHKYDYATEADIVSAVRAGMAERQLMLFPSVTDKSVRGSDKNTVTTLTVQYTVHDGESGESLSFNVIGEGQDAGDKGSYKAMTGATKYALLKLFLIPTGDDPEVEDEKPVASSRAHQQHAKPAPTKEDGAEIYKRILKIAESYGKDAKTVGSILKGALNKTSASQLVEADVATVERSLKAVASVPAK